jgi:hypothetical protein
MRQRDGLAILNTAAERRLTAREVIEFIATAPPELIRHWWCMDPWAMQQLRAKLAELADQNA